MRYLVLIMVTAWTTELGAQNVWELTATGNDEVTVYGSNTDTIQGWSLGVCSDVPPISAENGSTTATVNNGTTPDFNVYYVFANGWTAGVVIAFGSATLSPGSGYELHIAQYDVSGVGPGEEASVCTCNETLGSPPTANVIVVAGSPAIPIGADGECAQIGPGPDGLWSYRASNETAGACGGAGPNSTVVSFFIRDLDEDVLLDDTQGFSMGWSHTSQNGTNADPGIPQPGPDLATINGGAGPDFFGTNQFSNGWTVGCVYAFLGGVTLQYPSDAPPAVTVEYFYDLTQDDFIDLDVDNGLGSPPVANVVVVSGNSFPAQGASEPGGIDIVQVLLVPFVRGDCNDDGHVNIADAVRILDQLFAGGPVASCQDACDSNNDGMVEATDATYVLNYRFLDGPEPPAPFPGCGTGDCEASAGCAVSVCF